MKLTHISLFKKYSRWYIQYVDANGQRKQKSTGCENKNDAIRKLSELQNLVDTSKKSVLFSQFQKEFLRFAADTFSPTTQNIYRLTFGYFIQNIGDSALEDLTMKHIDLYKAVRLHAVSEKTVNRELQALKSSMYVAVRWGCIFYNPFARLQMCREAERKPRFLNQFEAKQLIEKVKETWLKEVIFMALSTGMRRSEIINLLWKNVDLDNRSITVESNIDYRTKFGKARVVPINDVLLQMLINKHNEKHSDLVFECKGKAIRSDRLTKGFKRYGERIGLDHSLTFHHLRHTFASWLIQSGVGIYEVQQLLGHSTIKMTEIYAHLLPNNLQKSVNRISLMFK